MNSLIKWPGGKSGEIRHIEQLIPPFNRYVEPFFGGGALFFHLRPSCAAINDISRSLIGFYRLVKAQDREFYDLLIGYSDSFSNLLRVCEENIDAVYALYEGFDRSADRITLAAGMTELVGDLSGELHAEFPSGLMPDWNAFLSMLAKMAADRIYRLAANNRKRPFGNDALRANLITGFASGYYMYFRRVFNDIEIGRVAAPSLQYRAANFYFIREYCYGSMFRYNSRGEFNIPYGGVTYNKKGFRAKVENLFSGEAAEAFRNTEISCCDFEQFLDGLILRENDFIFLDPPYDTDFSDYEGKAFTKTDQERLAYYLRGMPARFILIIKSTDYIREIYKDHFNILTFDNRYTYNMRSRNERNVEHLIVTNRRT